MTVGGSLENREKCPAVSAVLSTANILPSDKNRGATRQVAREDYWTDMLFFAMVTYGTLDVFGTVGEGFSDPRIMR